MLSAVLVVGFDWIDVRIRDLSKSGALLEGQMTVPAGTSVEMRRNEQSMQAEVVWCRANRCGIRFAAPIVLEDWAGVPLHEQRKIPVEQRPQAAPPAKPHPAAPVHVPPPPAQFAPAPAQYAPPPQPYSPPPQFEAEPQYEAQPQFAAAPIHAPASAPAPEYAPPPHYARAPSPDMPPAQYWQQPAVHPSDAGIEAQLPERIAEEIAFVQRIVQSIGRDIAANPLIARRHAGSLQNCRRADKLLGELAQILMAEDKLRAAARTATPELKNRLLR